MIENRKIRLYGPVIGHGSFSRVTAGMKKGLEANNVLAGYIPIDQFDPELVYPGSDAYYGIYIGPPNGVSVVHSIGWHKEQLMFVVPNSTWLPKQMIQALDEIVTGYLSPSTWAVKILQGYTKLPVKLYHHGIDTDYFNLDQEAINRVNEVFDNEFRVLHMASTPMQRKGTKELIQAWGELVSDDLLGPNPALNLVVDGNPFDFENLVRRYCQTDKAKASVVWVGRLDLDEATAAKLYRSQHIICQPSRGEGFGLCTLEALACGTPSVMTYCTGHEDQFHINPIETGNLEPIDDGPGALAPSLNPRDIKIALSFAFSTWKTTKKIVVKHNENIHKEWNWKTVTKKFLDSLEKDRRVK